MAASQPAPTPPDHLGFDENKFPIWRDAFASDERKQLIADDLEAGHKVFAVLLAIVIFGVLLGALGVLLAV